MTHHIQQQQTARLLHARWLALHTAAAGMPLALPLLTHTGYSMAAGCGLLVTDHHRTEWSMRVQRHAPVRVAASVTAAASVARSSSKQMAASALLLAG